MRGKIIRGVGGFYYVHAEDGVIYECRATGIFRKENIKPLVGDNAEISILNSGTSAGNVDALLERQNVLARPAAANVDQAMVMFAAARPKPNLGLLDRFLILMGRQGIPVIICFNKTDLAEEGQIHEIREIYRDCGCRLCFTSVAHGEGLDEVRMLLDGKTTVLAGPSGVGKSSLTNAFFPEQRMETGEISRKTRRGRQTTRHTELLVLPASEEAGGRDSYLLDTPGFSTLTLEDLAYEDLKNYYPEFSSYAGNCRFQTCMHLKEPDCAVKSAVEEGRIHRKRYDSYVSLAEELKNNRRY